MKKIIQTMICTSFLMFSSLNVIAEDTVIRIYNYETEAFENVDIMTISVEEAFLYMPNSNTIHALFQAYLKKGEPVSLALMSTLSDVSKARASADGTEGMLEVYNFKFMKKEMVDVSKLTNETAKDYIPQSDALFKLFDFYNEEYSIEQSLYRTLIDANKVLEEEPQ